MSLKQRLTRVLEANIPQTIKAQEKNILICEVVRLLVDENARLGFHVLPEVTHEATRRDRKSRLAQVLYDKYAQYKGPHALIKNIISDLIDEANKIGVTIVSR
jgi:endonuclease/exonuclease/phosphatase (EEP) superfamily protein YafD